MKFRELNLLLLVGAALILLTPAVSLCGVSYKVWGLIETSPGNYEKWPSGYYKYEYGYIFDYLDSNPNDEIDYYTTTMSDAAYCGDTHKAGGEKFNHWHVESGVSFPTTETPSWPDIKSIENEKFWDAIFLNNGKHDGVYLSSDGSSTESGIDDSQDSDSGSGSPDLTYNCHGYAFNKDGKTQYKLHINDNATGAGVIVDPANSVYEEVTHGSEVIDKDIMYMGTHTNYVADALETGCCNVLQLKFKFRNSRIYTYNYDWPGRDGAQLWDGKTPKYYQ